MRISNCVWLVLLLFLASCEIELGENYVEVERPGENMEVTALLSSANVGEVIETDGNSWLDYSLQMDKGQLIQCTFRINGQEWVFFTDKEMLYLDRAIFDKSGDYQLTCEAIYAVNYGSIAGQLGGEQYVCELSWTIRLTDFEIPDNSLRYEINEAGQLVLRWGKPKINELRFTSYLVHTNGRAVTIEDINQTSYTVEGFFGQVLHCQVMVMMKNHDSSLLGYIVTEEVKPTLTIEEREGRRYICWDNRYERWVTIHKNYTLLYENYTGQEIDITGEQFGRWEDFYNFDFHAPEEKDYYEESIYMNLSVPMHSGKRIETDGYWLQVAYSAKNNRIYSKHFAEELVSWQLPELEKKASSYLSGSGYDYMFSNPSHTDQIALYSGVTHSILIYDGDVELKQVISLDIDDQIRFPFVLTDDNKVVTFHSDGQHGMVYDIERGLLVKKFDIFANTGWHTANLSPDYRFLVYSEGASQGLHVINYRDFEIEKQMTFPTGFSSWCVHPTQHHRLFVADNGKIMEYNLEDLNMVNSFMTDGLTVANIDPKTGYMLLTNSQYAVIMNPDSGEELYRIAVVEDIGSIQYYGNTLISEYGFVLNLDDKIK